METSSGNDVPLGINLREDGDFSKKKKKPQNINSVWVPKSAGSKDSLYEDIS